MADKAGDKKAAPAPSGDSIEQKIINFALVLCLLFLIIVPAIAAFFSVDTSSLSDMDSLKELFISVVSRTFVFVVFVSVFLSLVFGLAWSYAHLRMNQIVENWKKSNLLVNGAAPTVDKISGSAVGEGGAGLSILANIPTAGSPGGTVAVHGPQAEGGNAQWQDIEQKINSANPADWRLAILEADIVLSNMLNDMGLPGESLGEKLRSADPSFFHNLNEAWQAHKLRNIIAHEGTAYNLTYNEARRAIDLYRRVFEEFYYI